MKDLKVAKKAFNAGILARELKWRTDLEKHALACEELENFNISILGSISRREGTKALFNFGKIIEETEEPEEDFEEQEDTSEEGEFDPVVFFASDEQVYNLKTGEIVYGTSAFEEYKSYTYFEWRDIPTIDDCDTNGGWYLNYTIGGYENARWGVVLKGKIGDKFTISIPYKKYTTTYNTGTVKRPWSDTTYCTRDDDTYSDSEEVGYIEAEFTIGSSDVITNTSDGYALAGYNINVLNDSLNGITDASDLSIELADNEDFLLPISDGINETYFIGEDPVWLELNDFEATIDEEEGIITGTTTSGADFTITIESSTGSLSSGGTFSGSYSYNIHAGGGSASSGSVEIEVEATTFTGTFESYKGSSGTTSGTLSKGKTYKGTFKKNEKTVIPSVITDYTLIVSSDRYNYHLNSDTHSYQCKYARKISNAGFSAYAWRDLPEMPTCETGSFNVAYNYWYTKNSYWGCIAKGNIGDTLSIALPYKGQTRTLTTGQASSNPLNCVVYNPDNGKEDVGEVNVSLTITESNVLKTNDDGSVYAGFNVSWSNADYVDSLIAEAEASGNSETNSITRDSFVLASLNIDSIDVDFIVAQKAGFELPTPPTNEEYSFNSGDFL